MGSMRLPPDQVILYRFFEKTSGASAGMRFFVNVGILLFKNDSRKKVKPSCAVRCYAKNLRVGLNRDHFIYRLDRVRRGSLARSIRRIRRLYSSGSQNLFIGIESIYYVAIFTIV